MTAALPQPYISQHRFELALNLRFNMGAKMLSILTNWLIQQLDNHTLVLMGFRPVAETQLEPEAARMLAKTWSRLGKKWTVLRVNILRHQNDRLGPRFLRFADEVISTARLIEAVALLDQGPIAVSQATIEVQDEVLRIAALRTEASYWDEPDRQAWLEADLTAA